MTVLQRNTFANIVGRLATAMIWILVTPFVLSVLGKERFGVWALFFAFNSYFLSLDLGVGNTMLRYVATLRPSGDRRALGRTVRFGLGTAVGLGLLWALLLALLRGWIVEWFHVPVTMVPETLDALLIFAVGVLLIFPAQVLQAILRGFERLDLSNVCMVFGVVVHALVLYGVLSAGAGIRGAAMAGAVGQGVVTAMAAAMVRRQMSDVVQTGTGTVPTWRDLAQFSSAFQVLSLLIVLQHYSAKVLLGLLGNLGMVGEYELALRVSFAVFSVPVLIQIAVVPTVSRLRESEGPAAVEALYGSTSRWIHMVTVVALGSLWVLAPDVARLWLGPGHEHVGDLIRLSAVAYALCLAYSPGIAIARGLGRPEFEIGSYLAAALTNIGLTIWWVPRWGTAGAVVAGAISFAVGFLVFVPTFHRGCNIPVGPFVRGLARRALAGVFAVACSAGLLLVGKAPGWLPPLGWTHAAVAELLFVSLFALFFLPLGDTQRLSQLLWRMAAKIMVRRVARAS